MTRVSVLTRLTLVSGAATLAGCGLSDQGPGAAARIEITPSRDTIESFSQRELQVVVYDARGRVIPNAAFTSSSSNPELVGVSGAAVSGYEWRTPQFTQPVDSATITVQSGSATGTALIVLLPRITELRIEGAPQFLLRGGSMEYAPFIHTPKAGSVGTAILPPSILVWETSNPAVFTVSADGLVTSTGDGTADLTVSHRGYSDVLPITVGEPLYDVVDVGAAFADSIRATDMNDSGAVVGVHFPGGVATAFMWDAGSVTDLDGCVVFASSILRVNSAGQVLCRMSESAGARTGLWHDGSLAAVPGTDETFEGAALNDSGDVVGGMRLLSKGAFSDIPPKQGIMDPSAAEVNNRRQVLVKGYDIVNYYGSAGAYLWNAADGSTSGILTNGRYGSFARMNDSGVVVGTYAPVGVPSSGQSSYDINSEGDVVGTDLGRAFVIIDGVKYILNQTLVSDADLQSAAVINDGGQILSSGRLRSSGQRSWFLLTPRRESAAAARQR